MDCVCGCGTEIPKRLAPTNLLAFFLALEIAEWDQARTILDEAAGEPPSEAVNRFISEGMFLYDGCLGVLHGELPRSEVREIKRWRKHSSKQRKKLAKTGVPIYASASIEPTDERVNATNWKRPDQSYSGTEYDALAQIDREFGEN